MKSTVCNTLGEFGRITQSEISLQQNWQILQVSTLYELPKPAEGLPSWLSW